jgi:hypothetical protein
VYFDDGEKLWEQLAGMHPLDAEVGDKIECKWKGRPQYYPGRIAWREGERIKVNYSVHRRIKKAISILCTLQVRYSLYATFSGRDWSRTSDLSLIRTPWHFPLAFCGQEYLPISGYNSGVNEAENNHVALLFGLPV